MRRLALIVCATLSMGWLFAQDTTIVAIEYFIDDDPGYGLGTSVSMTSGTQVTVPNLLISTSAQELGFHQLFFRAQDEHGKWGMAESRLFYVDALGATARLVDELEYFFDSDPGFGNGTLISSFTAATEITTTSIIASTSLSPGFHTLYFRVRSGAEWGIIEQRLVYVDQQDVTAVLVDSLEYFFDQDPGYGNGTILDAFTPANQLTYAPLLASSGLSTGFHNLFIRAKAEGGAWGIPEQRLVFVNQSAVEAVLIDSLEYFFDEDPGYGNGTILDAFTPANQLTDAPLLASSGLSTGFHNLFIRAKAEGGVWGIPEQRLLYVDQTNVTANIDLMEYYFDEDPGYGLATAISSFTPAVTLDFTEILATSGLTTGFHTLFIRSRLEGGEWGIPEGRLLFVDESGAIGIVDQIEYFFDEDPGYGNGIPVTSFTAAAAIDMTDVIDGSTLSLGFHQVFFRARHQGGKWGMPEARLIYVDELGTVVSDITELEYYFDTDPGYGAGTTIPIATPLPQIDIGLSISSSGLSEGVHSLHVRARDADGVWGPIESFSFSTFGPGRELDSASLRVVYEQLNGPNWPNRVGWLTAPMDNWYGVKLTNGRVDTLDLSSNQLMGTIPFQLGYLNAMTQLDLSENFISDTVPLTFEDLTSLEDLRLYANHLNELPDLSGLANLSVAHLDSNLFDFGDLEPLAGLGTFTYGNQRIFGDMPIDSMVAIGQPLSWTILVEGANNEFQWYLNDEAIPSADLPVYNLSAFSALDTGHYFLQVNNSVLPDLTLSSEKYRFYLSGFEEDSLAMVSLYQSTAGSGWTSQSNWLAGPLATWQGVTLTGDRITDLSLPGNNLAGKIPKDFAYASELMTVDLSNNGIIDSIPASFNQIGGLTTLDLADNDIRAIPNFSPLQNLLTLDVSGNRLQFGDLENNLGIASFTYANQDSVTFGRDTLFDSNTNVTLQVEVSGANNQYQWIKDEEPLSGETADRLDIQNIEFANEGTYRLSVTNSLVPNLTLTSGEIRVGITSLARDSTALRLVYDQTGGANWSSGVNWLNNPITSWDNVVVANNRVTEVTLPGEGLVGTLPGRIRDITSLETLDLSDNDLENIPNMSQMPNLADLDVTGNRLHPDDLEPNVAMSGISFNPQQPIPVSSDTVLVEQGLSHEMSVAVGGKSNRYQWKRNGVAVEGATASSYQIDSITYDNMGLYTVDITSPLIAAEDPGFILTTEDQRILATATIEFTPTFTFADGSAGIVEEGSGTLIRKKDSGPYDSIAVVPIQSQRILFEDVILGDYLLAARAADGYQQIKNINGENDTVRFIPTYFENELEWDSAEVLSLRENITDALTMLRIPPPPDFGVGTVFVTVESDFTENQPGRLETRRRVRKAGCSLRRNTRVGGGREEEEEEWELIAYQETDDNGEVDFGELPAGLYRINIQYPGIPMDPDSFIEFSISEDEEEDGYILSATIYEDRIEVLVIEELGYLIEYFKDLSVYPNPADEQLTISYLKLNSDAIKYQLVNLEGKEIKAGSLDRGRAQKYSLETSDLKEGIYLLRIYDAAKNSKGLITYKVIVNH